jgi:hypothetical protein
MFWRFVRFWISFGSWIGWAPHSSLSVLLSLILGLISILWGYVFIPKNFYGRCQEFRSFFLFTASSVPYRTEPYRRDSASTIVATNIFIVAASWCFRVGRFSLGSRSWVNRWRYWAVFYLLPAVWPYSKGNCFADFDNGTFKYYC